MRSFRSRGKHRLRKARESAAFDAVLPKAARRMIPPRLSANADWHRIGPDRQVKDVNDLRPSRQISTGKRPLNPRPDPRHLDSGDCLLGRTSSMRGSVCRSVGSPPAPPAPGRVPSTLKVTRFKAQLGDHPALDGSVAREGRPPIASFEIDIAVEQTARSCLPSQPPQPPSEGRMPCCTMRRAFMANRMLLR